MFDAGYIDEFGSCPEEEDLAAPIVGLNIDCPVERIPFTKNGVKLLSHTWEITFACPKVPNKLKVGFLALSVAPYIPNPMRCFKCQLFGHHQGYCKRDATLSAANVANKTMTTKLAHKTLAVLTVFHI